MQYENLNKENFWNDLHARFPIGTQVFCDWIDKWKAENGWGSLRLELKDQDSTHYEPVKFHDYPLAVQAGILAQFDTEVNGQTVEDPTGSMQDSATRLIKALNVGSCQECKKT